MCGEETVGFEIIYFTVWHEQYNMKYKTRTVFSWGEKRYENDIVSQIYAFSTKNTKQNYKNTGIIKLILTN